MMRRTGVLRNAGDYASSLAKRPMFAGRAVYGTEYLSADSRIAEDEATISGNQLRRRSVAGG